MTTEGKPAYVAISTAGVRGGASRLTARHYDRATREHLAQEHTHLASTDLAENAGRPSRTRGR